MKKLSVIILVIFIILFCASCIGQEGPRQVDAQQSDSQQSDTQQSDAQQFDGPRISIVCTIFPQYDWVRQIIGEELAHRFDITFLINSGIDLHSFNPSVRDMTRIKTSDVFIHVGGHSENWVDDVLRGADPDMVTLNMMEVLIDVLGEQNLLEGFCEDDCDDDHDHNFDEPHSDEHVWLSLRRSKILCEAIADMLAEIDPENAQTYRENVQAYIARLSALDAEYQAMVDAARVRTLVIADRFPFRYMMDDYDLTAYAAFQGCSAESEASFVTVISLATRLNQLGLDVVLVTESSDQSIARTVIENTETGNQRILVLDAVHSVTVAVAETGVSYLSLMEQNLAVLREALM